MSDHEWAQLKLRELVRRVLLAQAREWLLLAKRVK
jgi:hypothetical protein